MLEQYQKDHPHDALSENQFQMSQRKLVFTLAGAALVLLVFLFLIGTFKEEDETIPQNQPVIKASIEAKLQDFDARLAKLEQQTTLIAAATETKPSPEITFDPQMFEESVPQVAQNSPTMPLSNEALKQLVPTSPVEEIAIPQPTVASTPVTKIAPPRTYIVQPGDSLSKISSKVYGTTKNWKEIYAANRELISNMNQLKVGTQLTIPENP